jgi:anti-sigma B factor antagonist
MRTRIQTRSNGRVTVLLEGEIDLSTVPVVREALGACLAMRMTDIDVDLTGVGFCDASGLNLFLALSQRLADSHGQLRLRHPAPIVRRLLDLTGTGYLLAEGHTGAERMQTGISRPSSGAA